MKNKIFAICDPEKEYAERFSDYVREHGNIPLDTHIFSGIAELREFMRTRAIEILLLSERLIRDDIPEWPIGTVIVLQEESSGRPDRFPGVYKYRSAREVIREVMDIYGQCECITAGERILKPVCKVIGVYSPISRCFKTTFALALGQILAAKKPVLYLNFEEFPGMEQLLHEEYENNIGDLIYLMRQGERDLVSSMASFAGHLASLDFIPPCAFGQGLRSVTPEEWHELLREIIEHSSYEAVILDLGNGVGHLEDLLTECEVIYMPVGNDIYAEAKTTAFEWFLQISGTNRTAGKIRRLQLKGNELPETRDRYLQQIVWSDIGDRARECIRRDEL